MLEEYLVLIEEAKKRDHRKIGKEMELFTFSQNVGQGLPLWLPKGAVLREQAGTVPEKGTERSRIRAGHHPPYRRYQPVQNLGPFAEIRAESFQPINTPQKARNTC